MALQGPIADAARRQLPVTWDALSTSEEFGDGFLQDVIDLEKESLFGTVIDPSEEDDYPLRVLNYLGKKVALALITPGVDYWMSETISRTVDTPNEVETLTDRAVRLQELGKALGLQVKMAEDEILALLGKPKPLRYYPRPGISTPTDDVLLTPNPREFPRQYRA